MPIATFKSPKAIATIDKIIALLQRLGGASAWDIALVTGHTREHVGLYLRHMEKRGLVECTEPAVAIPGGSTAARWELAPDFDQVEEMLSNRDDFQRQVIVRKEWKPNHVRMMFDCYLFGTPKILEESHA